MSHGRVQEAVARAVQKLIRVVLTGTHALSRALVAASQAYRASRIKQPDDLLAEPGPRKVDGRIPGVPVHQEACAGVSYAASR